MRSTTRLGARDTLCGARIANDSRRPGASNDIPVWMPRSWGDTAVVDKASPRIEVALRKPREPLKRHRARRLADARVELVDGLLPTSLPS